MEKTLSKHSSSKTPLTLLCLLTVILSKHRNPKTSILIGHQEGEAGGSIYLYLHTTEHGKREIELSISLSDEM
jgi:hypothetical protein